MLQESQHELNAWRSRRRLARHAHVVLAVMLTAALVMWVPALATATESSGSSASSTQDESSLVQNGDANGTGAQGDAAQGGGSQGEGPQGDAAAGGVSGDDAGAAAGGTAGSDASATSLDNAASTATATGADVATPTAVDADHEHTYSNGFCTECDARQEATEVSGVYQIENGGQLFWFAEQVNAGTIDADSDAVLTNDINLEGSSHGVATGYEDVIKNRNFPGIGWDRPTGYSDSHWTYANDAVPYRGDFDGGGYAISDLLIDGVNNSLSRGTFCGFFGAAVNASIHDFTLEGKMALGRDEGFTDTGREIGTVIGGADGGSVTNVTSKVSIADNGGQFHHVGGVVGAANYLQIDSSASRSHLTISQCLFDGSISLSDSPDCIGGIVGYSFADVTIEYCANLGSVSSACSSEAPYVGGILGYINHTASTSLSHCYNYGAVSNGNSSNCGGIIGCVNSIQSCTTNCTIDSVPAYGGGNAANSLSATLLTNDQFASGEACYLLNGTNAGTDASVWRQTIGTDATPNFTGAVVRANTTHDCTAGTSTINSYTNDAVEVTHENHNYSNGFCTVCDARQPATKNANGVYEITNGGQLFWFAEQVNSGAIDAGSDAVLTADIDLEGSLHGADATYEGVTKDRNFPGIGWDRPTGQRSGATAGILDYASDAKRYQGDFDGGGYAISDLLITGVNNPSSEGNFCGFFGCTVNATIHDFTIEGKITLKGDENDSSYKYFGREIGTVIGGADGGSVTNVTSRVSITDDGGEYFHVGGIVGGANYQQHSASTSTLTISQCLFEGSINLYNSYDCIGGIVGYSFARATIDYCANLGSVKSIYSDSSAPSVGGVLGYINNNSYTSLSHCYNYGTVSNGRTSNYGGIIGCVNSIQSCTTNCTIESVPAYGGGSAATSASATTTTFTTAEFASGAACYFLNDKTTSESNIWSQDIDNGNAPASYPMFNQDVVYPHSDDTYSNYPESVSVTITWGAMGFDYEQGAWNPTTHTYDGSGFGVATTGGDAITVTNDSNVAIKAAFSFAPSDGFNSCGLSGTFSKLTSGVAQRLEKDGEDGDELTTSLSLSATSAEGVHDAFQNAGTNATLGTITVSLSTAGSGA